MLEVLTYIAESKIAGNGVFSSHDIPKGTIVWKESEFNHIIPPASVSDEHPNFKKYILNFGYLTDMGWILCVDNAKFMNHSENPNLIESIVDGLSVNVAVCDIKAHEELTCNYWHFDKDTSRKLGK